MAYLSSSPAPVEELSVQQLSDPIYQARGWLKLLGVLSIAGGAMQALSIVGIIVAWLPIWMGVLLYQAASAIESAAQAGDRFAFLRSLNNLKTYFIIQGVLTLVGILVSLIAVCLAIVLPLLGISLIPWNEISNYSY